MPPDNAERELQRVDIAADIMSDWLRGGVTGCVFAQVFAGSLSRKSRGKTAKRAELAVLWPYVVFRPLEQPLGELIEPVLIDCATYHRLAVVMFPDVRREDEIADIVTLLARHPSWSWKRRDWKSLPREDVLIGLEWKTPSGHYSSALGVAPLGTMPFTRRAPFAGVIVWPGSHENEQYTYWQKKPEEVGVADMAHRLNKATHARYWKQSVANKKRLAQFGEGAAEHDVTFCLTSVGASRLK